MDKCQERQDEVHGKVQYCQDLHTADASSIRKPNFRTDKAITKIRARDGDTAMKGVKTGQVVRCQQGNCVLPSHAISPRL